jgi:hypothetical protein
LAQPGGAAVGLPGVGLLDGRGGGRPVPIASLAKILTGYLVLRDHPLPAGGSGPAITVTAADAAAFAGDQRQGQSVVQVVRGEKLTELQALQAMLIPLRQQHRLPAGPLGCGLARGVRGQDERRGRPARAAQHAVRRRQRR